MSTATAAESSVSIQLMEVSEGVLQTTSSRPHPPDHVLQTTSSRSSDCICSPEWSETLRRTAKIARQLSLRDDNLKLLVIGLAVRLSPLRLVGPVRFTFISAARRGAVISEGSVGTCALNTLVKNKNNPDTMAVMPDRNLWSLSDIWCTQHKDHTSVHDSLAHAGIWWDLSSVLYDFPVLRPSSNQNQLLIMHRVVLKAHARTHRAAFDWENTLERFQ